MLENLTLQSVLAAAERIAPHVVRTPVLRHALADAGGEPGHDRAGGLRTELLLKAESLQPIGAFKLRGAFSLMTTLIAGIPGVVAHSSGNHAQAVACAAARLGLRAVIVMPSDAPELKRKRTAAWGAEIVTVGPDSDERAERCESIAATEGLAIVPPYDHPLVAAGQGTAALELFEDVGAMSRFYAPVSGGGLMAGCATVLAALSPDTEIIGVEPRDGDDTARSLAAGERVEVPPPQTIADGLRVRRPGALTFPVVQAHVARIELVDDDELLDTMAWALTHLHLVLEPSGAAALAVARREGAASPGATTRAGTNQAEVMRAGVILSGGNVDSGLLAEVVARAGGMMARPPRSPAP